jgi:hypothetical protein
MLRLARLVRRPAAPVAFDDRIGDVCTRACMAAARRERDHERVLQLHGPR